MAFDNPTRNRLQRVVGDCRDLLTKEFDSQLQEIYGIYALEGRVLDIERLPHLDDQQLRVAVLLRERIDYLAIGGGRTDAAVTNAVRRVLREQAFTIVNRFVALRMAEERGIIVESVGAGFNSKAFKTFSEVAFSGLGDSYQRYRVFLFCLCDEMSTDLGVLFDRQSPYGLLFPRENVLMELFDLLNAQEMKPLWQEDETIGWIYQYFNDPTERKKMREESAVPRNSRELAVRNQFFTPRYVVEFLTDNTLGRIWYEMTQGETELKENCRYLVRRPNEIFLKPGEIAPEQPDPEIPLQEELLKQHIHIPHRQLKDPRTILMLDPACGSMHFGLYAFDLFEVIYHEAWAIEEKFGADALGRSTELKPLHDTYIEKNAFLRDVPRLIIERNIHGIDIDPRCAQIAGLSLWLRAQKSWQRLGLKPADRPTIKRSNIVSAEPMPGDKDLLREFVEREFPADKNLFLPLLEEIFDKMQLAGEAGSLLKIEEEIRSAIAEAKNFWKEGPQLEQSKLFAEFDPAKQQGLKIDLNGVTDEQFWDTAENRIYTALREYAEQAENGGGFQRRLFAEDAGRGFAFIDVCRKRYDATVMNPPFGIPPDRVAGLLSQDTANNIYPAFVLRGAEMSVGFVGAITDRTFVVQQSFGKFRARLTSSDINLVALADLGWGVLDGADVQVATYFVRKGVENFHLFASLASSGGMANEELRRVIMEMKWTSLTKEVIGKLPNNAFAYTLPAAYLNQLGIQPSLRDLAVLPRGLGSNDANRTYKAWYEVPANTIGLGQRYSSLSNGGPCSPFFRDDAGVAEWLREDGALLVEKGYSDEVQAYDQRNCEHYFSAGLSFPKQSSIFNVAALPQDAIPTREGKGIILRESVELLYMLAYLNSAYARFFVEATNGLHKQSGPVGMTPVPIFTDDAKTELAFVALSAWQSIATTYRFDEACRLFVRAVHPKEFDQAKLLSSNEVFNRIDEIVFREMDMSPNDRAAISLSVQPEFVWFIPTIADELSYVLGCALGRWDIRYARGEKATPELPEPFAPLPMCPPGQLQNAQGLPARPEDVPAAYPIRIPWDGILVDDPNHLLDIERRIRDAIEVIWKDRAESIEHEACEILGVKSLREYFQKPARFFSDHLKRYSKSRRQAPIYWPLSTASGSYTLWVYSHRLTDQTLFQCVNDFVKPKIAEVEADLSRITSSGTDKPGNRAEIERLTTLRAELLDFRDELLRVAQLPYKPNLNDGVLITASPLWKLFRLPKWQKDLKFCWESLSKGEYDWAHLALPIWPQRVKDTCRKDRSVAIAHGLEELCEVKSPEKKAKKGKKRQQFELTEDAK